MQFFDSQAARTRSDIATARQKATLPGNRLQIDALPRDVFNSLRHYDYWTYTSWLEVMLKYRSTFLGPIWIVAGMALFVTVLGALYQRVLVQTHPTYLAHLTIGMILWTVINGFLVGCCRIYKTNNYLILNGRVRYPDYVLKLLLTNIIIMLHNMIVLIGVFIFTQVTLSPTVWILVVTAPLVVFSLLGVGFLFSVLGARFLDFSELLQSIFRIAFFVTPIVWTPTKHGFGLFLYLNPFYYMLEVIRAPIIDDRIPWLEIFAVAGGAPIVWLLAMYVYARGKNYIPSWI